MTNEIEIRVAKLEDIPFIYSTWLRSYRHASQFARKITTNVFYEMHHKVIDRFIERGGEVYIAHPAGEPDVILGYLCMDTVQPVAQYIYVKKPFRKMGIARALIKDKDIKLFTHWTADTDWIVKKISGLIYNPYLV